jgi:DNA-directed RNA polymerase specialized sigma24 family protein
MGDPDEEEGEAHRLDLTLPSLEAGPEAQYARLVLLQALQEAVDALPESQREVFVAHEIEGRSFKAMAAQSGVTVNTLLARKRYAVLALRARLQTVYDEFET